MIRSKKYIHTSKLNKKLDKTIGKIQLKLQKVSESWRFLAAARARVVANKRALLLSVKKVKKKGVKLKSIAKDVEMLLTGSKEGNCKRNQNDPNYSHVIFEGKSTL